MEWKGKTNMTPTSMSLCRHERMTHGLVMVTVADLARYRLESEHERSLWALDASFLCV